MIESCLCACWLWQRQKNSLETFGETEEVARQQNAEDLALAIPCWARRCQQQTIFGFPENDIFGCRTMIEKHYLPHALVV